MTVPKTLADWLAHCERTHTKSIDLGLERMQVLRDRLGLGFDVPVITVAGTNGKGSTCAMIESIALRAGWRVGAYTKPHLVHFEERCRVGGADCDAEMLLPHFEAVEHARRDTPLTYYEFTTLAILRVLASQTLDLVILEVGLGGRLDAVNAIDADCAVITCIDIDHVEYLGPDRESIGREKAHIMRGGRPAVLSDPLPPASVVEHGQRIGADLWRVGRDFNHGGDRQQWNWAGRGRRYNGLAYPALRGANQILNASGSIAALESLRERLPITAQAVRNGLALVQLPGRFQVLAGRPTIVLDVAHNPHAVAQLAVNLDAMGFFPRTHAVFGVMRDKDFPAIVQRMAPLVDCWHLCDLDTARAATAAELAEAARAITKAPLHKHPAPGVALRAAMAGADPADRIVVFGSFYTVGGVLKEGLPEPTARHAT
jgi:dihydrofolate synthase/folylpolyglutamate synthase